MNETFIIEKSYDRFVYEVVGSLNSEKKTDEIEQNTLSLMILK